MNWEEFKEYGYSNPTYPNMIETDISCPVCGRSIYMRTDIVLTSFPAQYQYECKCGWIGYAFTEWSK